MYVDVLILDSQLKGRTVEQGRGTLLHKTADGRTSPFPGQTYPTTFVRGVPSAV